MSVLFFMGCRKAGKLCWRKASNSFTPQRYTGIEPQRMEKAIEGNTQLL